MDTFTNLPDKRGKSVWILVIYFFTCETAMHILVDLADFFNVPTVKRFVSEDNGAGGNLIIYFGLALIFFFAFAHEFTCMIKDFLHMKGREFQKLLVCDTFGVGIGVWLAQAVVSLCLFALGITSSNETALQAAGVKGLWLWTISMVFFTPFVEEVIFRYVIFGMLYEKARWLAYMISSMAFGLQHTLSYVVYGGDLSQIFVALPYSFMGFGFCLIYARTKNLCFPWLFHVFLNGMSRVGIALL